MAESYDNQSPEADKLLQPDGSEVTRSGEVVTPPSAEGAALYAMMSPQADKLLQPDGSIITRSEIVGGGSSGNGGGADIFKVIGGEGPSDKPFILSGKKKGFYYFSSTDNLTNPRQTVYIKHKITNTSNLSVPNSEINNLMLLVDVDDDSTGLVGMTVNNSTGIMSSINIAATQASGLSTSGSYNEYYACRYLTTSAQNFRGVKTFYALPAMGDDTMPTTARQFTPKAYVDGSIAHLLERITALENALGITG